jgi:lactose/L-arabinose transport system substrate-binding protein
MKRLLVLGAALALTLASAQQMQGNPNLRGEITVWSWDIAAKALEANIPGFNRLFPNVRVRVLDLGNQATYDRGLAVPRVGATYPMCTPLRTMRLRCSGPASPTASPT